MRPESWTAVRAGSQGETRELDKDSARFLGENPLYLWKSRPRYLFLLTTAIFIDTCQS